MSYSYNRRKKDLKQARSLEERVIDRKIRSGEYPRFVVRGTDKDFPRVPHPAKRRGKITWKQTATKTLLLDTLEK